MEKKKILVVEDNPINMELISDLLEINGYEVLKATSGLQMFKIMGSTPTPTSTSSLSTVPDLILMDIQIPEVDGLTLTRRLKEDPLTKDIPIIALTAHAMKGDRERALEAGCVDYIPKPFDMEEFISKISKFL